MYYKELNLSFDPFVYLPAHYYEPELHKHFSVFNKKITDIEHLGPDIVNWAKKHKLELFNCMFFSYRPYSKSAIHVDAFYDTPLHFKPLCALNFSKGGDGQMEWYESDSPVKRYTDVAKTPYLDFSLDKSKLVAACKISQPTLVKVDIPHRGNNMSSDFRYSITVRWLPPKGIEEDLELFREFE